MVSIMLVLDKIWIFLFKFVVIEIIVKLIMFVIIIIWIVVVEGKLNR